MGKQLIFQLGTNNWQRQGEFAPGSGILHQAHHDCLNAAIENTQSFSVYPSKNQKQELLAAEEQPCVRIFPLEHDIPICESISPVSTYRWHSMSEEEFAAYRKRLADFCLSFIDEIEAKEGQPISRAIAHHSFLNPIILCDVNAARVASGKPQIPFAVFVHGTALKMFHNELAGDNQNEFPMRFTPFVRTAVDGGSALAKAETIYIISEAERAKLLSVYEGLQTPITLSPNGVNMIIFHPQPDKTREAVLSALETKPYEGSGKEPQPLPSSFTHMVVFVGKFADWKRLDCLLKAAAIYEKSIEEGGESVITIIAGSGPLDSQKLYMDMPQALGLKNVYFVGPRPQPILADLYSTGSVGVFPSYGEPFGMVFVECMACGTPVIGADSGGPKDFVSPEVGALVPEVPAFGEDTDRFVSDLATTITKSLKENWKETKGVIR
uniref:Glycosyl transferase family 1 domain-containing protein n=1 Tax=Haptolina brevifila TaxID=156173 RepID=A0A7S2BMT8_9EUKA|mmetsp:Transcript_14655/g.29376  ORF Transcript_14655/g.29376 Transcript_14655/m.29376 type:complete len:438 (+) Transcript_14655:74-1387(+)